MTQTTSTSRALAALGHDTRLAIFRLLVRAGDEGLSVGEVGQHLGHAPSTLAHHLSTLVDAGLVTQERQGRTILNRVEFAAMRSMLDFLTAECCTGVRLAKTDTAA
ncbi:MAG: metalloregulator ArsR/SmtB family transcription factor [Roseovarius sp.]|nr:metalloregulator ArsR/SmtB family transcription factor [Roseovarius sp.]